MALKSRGSLEIVHKDNLGAEKVKRIYRRAILPDGTERLDDLEYLAAESTPTRLAYKDLRHDGRTIYIYV